MSDQLWPFHAVLSFFAISSCFVLNTSVRFLHRRAVFQLPLTISYHIHLSGRRNFCSSGVGSVSVFFCSFQNDLFRSTFSDQLGRSVLAVDVAKRAVFWQRCIGFENILFTRRVSISRKFIHLPRTTNSHAIVLSTLATTVTLNRRSLTSSLDCNNRI